MRSTSPNRPAGSDGHAMDRALYERRADQPLDRRRLLPPRRAVGPLHVPSLPLLAERSVRRRPLGADPPSLHRRRHGARLRLAGGALLAPQPARGPRPAVAAAM